MSAQPTHNRPQSINFEQRQQVRFNPNESDNDSTPIREALPNILPEVDK